MSTQRKTAMAVGIVSGVLGLAFGAYLLVNTTLRAAVGAVADSDGMALAVAILLTILGGFAVAGALRLREHPSSAWGFLLVTAIFYAIPGILTWITYLLDRPDPNTSGAQLLAGPDGFVVFAPLVRQFVVMDLGVSACMVVAAVLAFLVRGADPIHSQTPTESDSDLPYGAPPAIG
ncbi:MAG: hypothetical protein HY876_06405 [Coriobacteriales bacterium]|nr:hypothetical protein [Coriobacteriales bacterium]